MAVTLEQINEKLEHINIKLDALTALVLKNGKHDMVPKSVFMAFTGWSSQTINNRVHEGYIKKVGRLYSLKSYYEYNKLLAAKKA